jgi:hypothetical protein
MHQNIQIQGVKIYVKTSWGERDEKSLSQKPAERKLGSRDTQTDNLKISLRTDGIK